MELEFDKEIDALLRKANRDSPAAVGVPSVAGHLDADELAAFAENAMPDRTRQFYIAHLADCDACRKTLSSFIAMNPEAAADAASVSARPAIATKLPWYKRLFAMPNLAYTMAALVVMFSGAIGLLVYQNQMAERSTQSRRLRPSTAPAVEKPETADRTESFSNAFDVQFDSEYSVRAHRSRVSPSRVLKSAQQTPDDVQLSTASNSNAARRSAAGCREQTCRVISRTPQKMSQIAPRQNPARCSAEHRPQRKKMLTTTGEIRIKKAAAKTDKCDRLVTILKQNGRSGKSNVRADMSPGSNSAKLRSVGPRQVQSQTQTQSQGRERRRQSGNGRAVSNLQNGRRKKIRISRRHLVRHRIHRPRQKGCETRNGQIPSTGRRLEKHRGPDRRNSRRRLEWTGLQDQIKKTGHRWPVFCTLTDNFKLIITI